MAILFTGPIENSPVLGTRPTQLVTVKITNRDAVNNSSVLIQGYVLTGVRTLYVSQAINVLANEVVTLNYFANLDAYEFVFTTGGLAEELTEISVWGKQSTGQLVDAHRLVAQENEV